MADTNWRAVEHWAQARLAAARLDLEATGRTLEQTEYTRGRIAVLKELIALPARFDADRAAQSMDGDPA